MYILTGVLTLATFIALLAIPFGQDKKKNFKTFLVALTLMLVSAIIVSNF